MRGAIAQVARVLVLVAVAALCGCSHDLDALRATPALRDGGPPEDEAGRGGSAGEPAGDAGAAGEGADAGTGDACEPCEALAPAALELGLRSCCRGIGKRECGLQLGEDGACWPLRVPGQPNNTCTGLTVQGMRFEGCCRPDARCGLLAGPLQLGCVARDDVLSAFSAAPAEAIACNYECERDAECGVGANDFVCTEDPRDPRTRICADVCRRDADCRRIAGQVCALSNDLANDVVRTICRSPVGDVPPGEACDAAEDCVHGVCVRSTGRDPMCTVMCRSHGDCESARCFGSQISSPSGDGVQTIDICEI